MGPNVRHAVGPWRAVATRSWPGRMCGRRPCPGRTAWPVSAASRRNRPRRRQAAAARSGPGPAAPAVSEPGHKSSNVPQALVPVTNGAVAAAQWYGSAIAVRGWRRANSSKGRSVRPAVVDAAPPAPEQDWTAPLGTRASDIPPAAPRPPPTAAPARRAPAEPHPRAPRVAHGELQQPGPARPANRPGGGGGRRAHRAVPRRLPAWRTYQHRTSARGRTGRADQCGSIPWGVTGSM